MIRLIQKKLWALRRFGRIPALRKLVRKTFALYLREGTIRRIPFGPLFGMKWHCSEDVQFWMPLGLYEQETAAWVQTHLRSGDVFFDVGANFGYFTLIGSRTVGTNGKVIAFEPVPKIAQALRRQIEINSIVNTEIREIALCDSAGKSLFEIETISANSHFSSIPINHARHNPKQSVIVTTTTLDQIVKTSNYVPDVVKIDVEGAEVLVLMGASELLDLGRTKLIISTHNENLKQQCIDIVLSKKYEVSDLPGFEHEIFCVPARKP